MIILAPKPRIEVRIWSMDYPEFALKRKKLTNTYLDSNFSIEILNNENHEVDQQRLSCVDWLLSWRLILEISGQLSSAKRRRVSKLSQATDECRKDAEKYARPQRRGPIKSKKYQNKSMTVIFCKNSSICNCNLLFLWNEKWDWY